MESELLSLIDDVDISNHSHVTAKLEFIKLVEKHENGQNIDAEFERISHLLKKINDDVDEQIVDYLLSIRKDKNLLIKVAIYNLHHYKDLECTYTILDDLMETYPNDKGVTYIYAKCLMNGIPILKKHLEENPPEQNTEPTCETEDFLSLDELYYKGEKLFEKLMQLEIEGSQTWLHSVRQILYLNEIGDSLISAKRRAQEYVSKFPQFPSLKVYYVEYLNHFHDIMSTVKVIGFCRDLLEQNLISTEETNLVINILKEANMRIATLKAV